MNTSVLDPLLSSFIVLGSLFLNAVFAACESAMLRVRLSVFDHELQDVVESDRLLAKVTAEGDRIIDTVRFGWAISLVAFFLAAFFLVYSTISTFLPINALWSPWLAGLFAASVPLAIQLLIGQMLAKAVGIISPIQVLKASARFVLFFGGLAAPVLNGCRAIASRFWAWKFHQVLPGLDFFGLQQASDTSRNDDPEMSTVAQLIFKNALLMRDLVVADVLLPRNQVRYFDLNLPLQENMEMAKSTGHTRFPLCIRDLDHCIGLIHIKDIFRYRGDIARVDLRRLKRNMIRIDSEEPLESALAKLLAHRMHMALVIDEFHGTEGVLTLERILEQLVGDIRDEFDADEEVLIQANDDTSELRVSGLTPLHEITAHFNVEFDSEEVSTIGGLITSELGRIPEAGQQLSIGDLSIEVISVEETRVLEVCLRKNSPAQATQSE